MKILDILSEAVDSGKIDSLRKKANAAWLNSAKYKSGKFTSQEHLEFVHHFVKKDVTERPEGMPDHVFKRTVNRSYAKHHITDDKAARSNNQTGSGQTGSGVEPASKEVANAARGEKNTPKSTGRNAVVAQKEVRKAGSNKKANQTAISDAKRKNDHTETKTDYDGDKHGAAKHHRNVGKAQTEANQRNAKAAPTAKPAASSGPATADRADKPESKASILRREKREKKLAKAAEEKKAQEADRKSR